MDWFEILVFCQNGKRLIEAEISFFVLLVFASLGLAA